MREQPDAQPFGKSILNDELGFCAAGLPPLIESPDGAGRIPAGACSLEELDELRRQCALIGGDGFSSKVAHPAHDIRVDSTFVVTCPYCGEEVEIYLEPDVRGTLIQDCEVCCNPWQLRVSGDDEEGERYVEVTRADGSE